MQSYTQLMHATLWAVTVVTLSNAAVGNRNEMLLTQAREERCVIGMGRQVADLEAQVAIFLRAYRETLEPVLVRPQPSTAAGQ